MLGEIYFNVFLLTTGRSCEPFKDTFVIDVTVDAERHMCVHHVIFG